MNNGDRIEQLERIRMEMIDFVNAKVDAMIAGVHTGSYVYELPLSVNSNLFKGKKPIAVIFPNGNVIDASSWKAVAIFILRQSIEDKARYEKIMELRGKVMGKSRMILADSPEGMSVPLEINESLYIEGKFDTESLLNVVKKHVLDNIGYDYSNLIIKYK